MTIYVVSAYEYHTFYIYYIRFYHRKLMLTCNAEARFTNSSLVDFTDFDHHCETCPRLSPF